MFGLSSHYQAFMVIGNPNQFWILQQMFGAEETKGCEGSGWVMSALDKWSMILQSWGVWKMDQETPGEASQWPRET